MFLLLMAAAAACVISSVFDFDVFYVEYVRINNSMVFLLLVGRLNNTPCTQCEVITVCSYLLDRVYII